MANTFKIKRSGTASQAPTSLEYGEIAINYADGKIFYKNSSNAVIGSKLLVNIVGTTNEVSVSESSGTFTISLPDSISVDTLNSSGNTNVSGKLSVLASLGDEGGEIFLAQAATNTTLGGGITIDSYRNKIRFFEQGGNARGAYIDLTECSNGVGTNLLSGGGGATNLDGLSDVTLTSSASGDFLKYNGSAWVNDPINLGTDTVGNYMTDVSAGTGISVSHTPGEGSTATISLADVVQNAQTATYTLVLTDKNKMIEMNVGSANILYVPTDASVNFPVGATIDILQTGAGKTQILAVTPGTTTINSASGSYLRAQWSSATLIKRAANTWVVVGDLATS